MLVTHMAFALLIGLALVNNVSLPVASGLFLLAVLIGSVFPDIDSADSLIGRKTRLVSIFLAHRGAIHSFLSLVFFSIVAYLLVLNLYLAAGFMLGFFSHLVLDSLTPKGISWLWPSKKRIRGVFRTTGIFDLMFLVFFLALDLLILL